MLWDVSTLERVRDCGRVSVTPDGGVGLIVSDGPDGERIAGYRGLASCGSVWACPRCSAIINQHRATELREALASWGLQGGTAALLTLTIRHHRGQRLRDLWDGVVGSWSRLTAGRPWKEFKTRAGVAGAIRVVEVTHGASGWHVHLHVLLFLESSGDAVAQLVALLTGQQPVLAAWQRIVGRAGLHALTQAQDLRPVNLAEGTCTLGGYFVKSGWDAAAEIACGSLKTARTGNMTPMALLRHFTATGDADALQLWHEWETASANRRQMTQSRGLRDRLQLLACKPDDAVADDADHGAEQTDEDIAGSQDRGDKPILILDAQTWRRVRDTDQLWRLLEMAEHAPTGSGTFGVPSSSADGAG
ncbi:MAG: protein rep [Geodermatophilaceae bacterium]|nr:protein rep [Geodermatophilaceae bacterium]